MPLYADSNYYYSGGSSQLFSPYYPGSSSLGSTSSAYSPYTSTYNRAISGSYVVPITPSRSSAYGLTSSSRYQPKLSTITESSPLMGVSRHSTLMPLTRINSPKYTSYTSSSTPIHTPKYIPPKPILINTADIDVSANRYRQRKEEILRKAQREHETHLNNVAESRREPQVVLKEKPEPSSAPKETEADGRVDRNYKQQQQEDESDEDPTHRNRSTIKRNRAVVRLSTIRSRSKNRNRGRVEDLYVPEPEEKKFKEPSAEKDQVPAEVTQEESKELQLPKETLQEVIFELDPKHHTVRRLSIPQCPTFHDICEDISSDKIDDDLNAGELRRRQSIIHTQEQQLLNQLQKSPSGTFQMINLERRDSHDSSDGQTPKRHSKRLSKKGNGVKRHKITAIVEVENAQQEGTFGLDAGKSSSPKFTVNVDSVEEHHEIHKVFKLPKKKNVKKVTKAKDQPLPEGFMAAIARPQPSPKKKMVEKKETFTATADFFTFDEKVTDQTVIDELKTTPTVEVKEAKADTKMSTKPEEISFISMEKPQSSEVKTVSSPNKVKAELKDDPKTPTKVHKSTAKTAETPSTPKFEKPFEEKFPSKKEEEITTTISSTAMESQEVKEDDMKFPAKVKEKVETVKTPKSDQIKENASKPITFLEKTSTISLELKTPTTPVKVKEFASAKPQMEEEKKSTSKKLKTSQSLESSMETPSNKSVEKSSSLTFELKTSSAPGAKDAVKEIIQTKPQSKEENKKTTLPSLKTSQSLDNVTKPNGTKTLEKSNSITVELKSPTTPTHKLLQSPSTATHKLGQSPSKEVIPEDIKVATPKPIRKAIKKSESGEDFWAQIGTRETLYMNKRKQELVESLWQKRENLLESTTSEEVKNLDEIKASVSQQKEEALEKAHNEEQMSQTSTIGRSTSNESALDKDGGELNKVLKQKEENKIEVSNKVKGKEEDAKQLVEAKKDKQIVSKLKEPEKKSAVSKVKDVFKSDEKSEKSLSPIKQKVTSPKIKPTADKAATELFDLESKEMKITDKLENLQPKISTPLTEANAKICSTSTTTTTTTTTPTKITGQVAKSPERQEQEESKAKQTTQAKSKSNNKNELDINKTSATATKTNDQPPALLATQPLTLAKDSSSSSVQVTESAAKAAATKQPETKAISVAEIKLTTSNTANDVGSKTKTVDAEAKSTKKLQAEAKKTTTPTKTKTQTPPKAKAKSSPLTSSSTAVNADQFITKAPAKSNTSPVKQSKLATSPSSPPSKTATQNAPTKKTPDAKKKTTNATSTNVNNIATTTKTPASNEPSSLSAFMSAPISTATPAAATTTTGEIRKTADGKCGDRLTDNVAAAVDDSDDATIVNNSDSTRGGNLSKFATVSNLAQCLQDVDADLDDYIPSSAEISEDENYIDDSDFDYSSIDGWYKFTPSMKKKIKQRRRKEKQAEQARFDPQKKVKIDTTRKLYVKEEAPRYPLVATPRPLWKREKIVYPVDESDESDSEESGSTEETEESDECSTSEEYEDELHPTASGGGATSGGSGNSNSDPNIIRMSTCSNDSGFEGGTAPSSPKKMLECDVNCHKKCERLTANLCGVNQKLIVEALANVKRGARETRDSPSTPPSSNPAYKIEPNEGQDDETSYTYSQFQKSGRFTPPATIIPRFKNYTVDDFHFLAVLGKGSFGKVLLAELRDTTYYYAVKCLKKDVVLEDDDVDSTLIERKVLALGTKHPYLCHLFCTFQTESHLFFVMEYLNGGDLMFHIQESGRFTEERARFYGAEIISGLKFLHKKGIIYRDLKLDNVLLDYEGHVRIADFGMCKLQIYLDKTADSFCGTPDYMAPEIIKGENYNQNVDWWSFGVLLYEMLIGQSPFSGCDEDELFWSICNEIPWFPVYISAEATSILKGLLEKDYTKRIGSQYSPAGDIVEHSFFRPIDWNMLEKREIVPPFRPQVKHPLDTQYFDRVFTRERVRLTPIDKDILQSMDQKQFLGFTYTNPHITLD